MADQVSAMPLSGWMSCACRARRRRWGLYLTGHPIDRYRLSLPAWHYANRLTGRWIKALEKSSAARSTGHGGRFDGSVSHRQTQRGRMASMLLDDRSGRIEVTLFSDACETYGELLTATGCWW